MLKIRFFGFLVVSILVLLASACSQNAKNTPELLAAIPLDSLDEVITKSGVAIDQDVSADGHGSLRVTATGPVTVRIAEIDGLSVENARLIYRAKLRIADLTGKAYLEMWCVFPGKGEFFSRALQEPPTGTNEWLTQETPFMLQAGQNPSMVKLNLVVEGTGTVWIDDIRLEKGAL